MTENTDNHSEEIEDIPEILSEVDEPFLPESMIKQKENNPAKSISNAESEKLEKQVRYADRMERHIYKRYGYKLLIGCLLGYGFLVLFDTIISGFNFAISAFADSFVELLKFVVSTLIGFVFSENLKNDKEK